MQKNSESLEENTENQSKNLENNQESSKFFGIPKETSNSSLKFRLSRIFSDENREILCLRLNEDESLLAAGSSDGNISIYSLKTLSILHEIPASASQNPITTLRWRPRAYPSRSPNVLVSGNSDGVLTYWHAKSGKYLLTLEEKENQILALDYASDGRTFATAGKDFWVRIYDETTKSLIHGFPPASWQSPGHGNRVFSLKFVPETPSLLISGGWDGNLHFWDLREKKSVASIYGPNISGDTVDFKEGEVLTGSHRNKDYLEVWDFASRKRKTSVSWEQEYYREGAYVYAAQFDEFAGEKLAVAACSGINEVKIFDLKENQKEIFKAFGFEKGCYAVDLGEKRLAFAGGDGDVFVYEIEKNNKKKYI